MAKNKNKKELTNEDVEQIVYSSMRLYGPLPPTVEEIASLDAELEHIKLPFSPADPVKLLERLGSAKKTPKSSLQDFPLLDNEYTRNLAHAAREGGELTEEVKQQMADDKAKFLREEHNDQ